MLDPTLPSSPLSVMATFGESIDPTAAISAILGTYPFSIGLIREILQNSDDAKALKQVRFTQTIKRFILISSLDSHTRST